jgi:hypothetical protein
MPSILCLSLIMVQFHSLQHSTLCSSINVVGVVCVVVSGRLLSTCCHENTFLAYGKAKHPSLLSEV